MVFAFHCNDCGKGVIRDSEEHDNSGCFESDDDKWFCANCFHKPKCWSCGDKFATHSTFRDALNEHELTCDECHKQEYLEQYKKIKKRKRLVIIDKPKCAENGCDCFAAKNKYYPDSEGGEYWTLCEKCYEKDQD